MPKLKSGSHQFANLHGEELCKFFYDAQLKYATGEVLPEPTTDGGHSVTIADGSWIYIDHWYGGDPLGGLTLVCFESKPCFTFSYHGLVKPYVQDKPAVVAFLMEALQHANIHTPWRGPNRYKRGDFSYRNQWQRGLRDFEGTELITSLRSGDTLYKLSYHGNIVDHD